MPKRRGRRPKNSLENLLDLCTGAQTRSISDYAQLIAGAWHKCLEGIFEASKYCAEAHDYLDDTEKKELVAALPFDRTVFVKLAAIGRDTRLNAPDVKKLLPAHYSTLYEITQLKGDELAEAVAANIIRPQMRRSEFVAWKKKRRGHRRGETSEGVITLPKGIYAAIRLPTNMSDYAQSEFDEILVRECERVGAELLYSKSEVAKFQREQERDRRRADNYMHREARKVIRNMKKERLKGRPPYVAKEIWRRRWPFAPDENSHRRPGHSGAYPGSFGVCRQA